MVVTNFTNIFVPPPLLPSKITKFYYNNSCQVLFQLFNLDLLTSDSHWSPKFPGVKYLEDFEQICFVSWLLSFSNIWHRRRHLKTNCFFFFFKFHSKLRLFAWDLFVKSNYKAPWIPKLPSNFTPGILAWFSFPPASLGAFRLPVSWTCSLLLADSIK